MADPDDNDSQLRGDGGSIRSIHDVAVVTPYRLGLTARVLRRLATNIVDVITTDGRYVRALAGAHGPVVAQVAQMRPDRLTVTIEGDPRDLERTLELITLMLGVGRDLMHFDRAAERVPWLQPLAARMRGVKPPRYASLWEAFVNVVAFQQLSLQAASTIVRRLIIASGQAVDGDGVSLHLFPGPERFLAAEVPALRATGLSGHKIDTLQQAAGALVNGTIDLATLEGLPSTAAASMLQEIRGIGPWTASVILLRGLGRLDVFPMNDTSVTRNLSLVAGPTEVDVDLIVDTLRPQQGMLYYHLLLARLEAHGELGVPWA